MAEGHPKNDQISREDFKYVFGVDRPWGDTPMTDKTMTTEEQREAIREGLAELMKPHVNYPEEMADTILAYLTEMGAVLRSHWADCKAPPSGKAFTAVIDGVRHIADCGCPNTAPLIGK